MTPVALEWLRRFRKYLTTERRYSTHTDTNYARDLDALVRFCDKEALADWRQLDSQHIRTFAMRSHAGGLAPKSIQRRLSAVRSFYEFLIRETLEHRKLRTSAGKNPTAQAEPAIETLPLDALAKLRSDELPTPNVLANPAVDVRAPKARRTLPHTLDADQMGRLLEIPPAPGNPLVARDRAIMELLYSSGLRLAELIALDVSHLLSDRTVHIESGKGRKGRIVPVGRKAIEALDAWLRERTTLVRAGEHALFVGRNGKRSGPRAVQTRVAYWARKQGLGVHVHPHLFRHSFASHLLESSRELRGVQELLGHADIATTQIYTHLDFQYLARIYEAAHPRARKKA
jgi:integrase/recombinase XerC